MPAERDQESSPSSVPQAVPLNRTLLAVGCGWLLPGLGHVLLGRVHRGILFCVLVLGSYGLGLAHGGRLALRDERQPFLTTLQVVANLGVGPIIDPVARLFVYGDAVYKMPSGLGGRSVSKHTRTFRERARSAASIYGTAYLWTAGLMNLLLLFDIWDIGRGRKP